MPVSVGRREACDKSARDIFPFGTLRAVSGGRDIPSEDGIGVGVGDMLELRPVIKRDLLGGWCSEDDDRRLFDLFALFGG